MMSTYMTPKQVAALLEVSSATIVRWVHDGLIPAMRIGHRTIKIPRVEIERIINKTQGVELQ